VLKQQVEELKKVVAERVPVSERDALLKAAADRCVSPVQCPIRTA
jgi:hypothetical protein